MKVFFLDAAEKWLLLRSIKNLGHPPETFDLADFLRRTFFWFEFRKKFKYILVTQIFMRSICVDWFNTSSAP